jgi:hypothetical protein
VQDLVQIVHGDALEADLSSATALFLYLVPQVCCCPRGAFCRLDSAEVIALVRAGDSSAAAKVRRWADSRRWWSDC